MKILLIYPPNRLGVRLVLPEGAARLASYLKKQGIDVSLESLDAKSFFLESSLNFKIFDNLTRVNKYLKGNIDEEIEHVIDKILSLSKSNEFDIIGFSIISRFQVIVSFLLADAIKKKRKDVRVIFGGSFFNSRDTKRIMEVKPVVDYIIIGEGEESLFKLILYISRDKNSLDKINGLLYKHRGKVVQNKIKPLDINTLPSVNYDEVINDYLKICKKNNFIRTLHSLGKFFYFNTRLFASFNKIYPSSQSSFAKKIYNNSPPSFSYQISKGCVGNCSFCNYKGNQNINLKSPRLIAIDIKRLVNKYNIRNFFFSCNTINLDNNHLKDLCLELITTQTAIRWASYARPENLNLKLLKLMKKAGCFALYYGIESGSQKVIDWLNKGFRIEEAEKVIRDTKKTGISTKIFLIINTPVEEEKDITNTVHFIERNKKYIHIVSIEKFCLLYGSKNYFDKNTYVDTNWENLRNRGHLKKLFEVIKRNNIALELPSYFTRRCFNEFSDCPPLRYF